MNGIALTQTQARFRLHVRNVFLHILLLAVTVTCLFPLLWMVRSALMDNETIFVEKALLPSELHPENFVKAWSEGQFGLYFVNSVIYTVCVVAGIILVASLAAYAFSRLRFPGRRVLFFMFLAAMMIPLPGSFVPLYVLMNKLHLINTRIGYILCMINVGLALSIFLLKTFFDKMPSALEDIARMDGCSKWGIWWHVALPMAKPAIAVIVIFNVLNVWNEYILANLLLNDETLMPLQKGLMEFQGIHIVEYPLLMAGLTITAVPVILVYVLMQRHIVKGLATGSVGD